MAQDKKTTMMISGFEAVVIDNGKGFTIYIPALRGVVGQVERKEDIVPEMENLIKVHMKEGFMANIPPKMKGHGMPELKPEAKKRIKN